MPIEPNAGNSEESVEAVRIRVINYAAYGMCASNPESLAKFHIDVFEAAVRAEERERWAKHAVGRQMDCEKMALDSKKERPASSWGGKAEAFGAMVRVLRTAGEE